MRRTPPSLALALAMACLLSSCSEEHEAGVLGLVRIQGAGYLDEGSATQIDEIRIDIYVKPSSGSAAWRQTHSNTYRVNPAALPFVFAIFPRDVKELYLAEVTISAAGHPVQTKIAIGSFVLDRVGVLEFVFVAGGLCFQKFCVDENGHFLEEEPCDDSLTNCVQACNDEDGECFDVGFTPGDELPEYDPEHPPEGVDRDASTDAGRDASLDAPSDGDDDDAETPECGPDLPACDDRVACTADSCDTDSGRCVFESSCDDGDPCTVDECDGGTGECTFASPCTDSTPGDCMTSVCEPNGDAFTCAPQPVDDGTACGEDVCCGGSCTDTTSDDLHCGASGCGVACGAGSSCTGGSCGCADDRVDCDAEVPGCETDPLTDEDHCGVDDECGGGDVCGVGESCIHGTCDTCMNDDDCLDSLDCTEDLCDGTTCSNEPATGCLIAGECIADGAPNPHGQICSACDSTMNARDWSPSPGTPCNDGNFCTENDACSDTSTGSSACVGDVRECDDGQPCTIDACSEVGDRCGYMVMSNRCLIDGTCYSFDERNPESDCQACIPGTSTYTWSSRTGMSCDDDLYCTTSDVCSGSGSCGGSPRNCSDVPACTADACNESGDQCEHPVMSGSCLIGTTCVAANTPMGGGGTPFCRVCNPFEDQYGFSPGNEGMTCGPSMTCQAGTCQASGTTCSMGCAISGGCGCSGMAGCYEIGSSDPDFPGDECAFYCLSAGHVGFAPPGTPCSDGMCNGSGACVAPCPMCEISPGVCGCDATGGGCYPISTIDPTNPCRSCMGSSSDPMIMDAPNGTSCSPPPGGSCQEGMCMEDDCPRDLPDAGMGCQEPI